MTHPHDEVTAYHEAGHAVLALALGRQAHAVNILPNGERLGVCAFRKVAFRPSEDWIEREILIALSGIAAEARHTDVHAWEAAGRDWQYIRDLVVERARDRRADRLANRLLSKADNLLAEAGHWRVVEQIAAALLKYGTVSGRAVRHLFEQCRDEH